MVISWIFILGLLALGTFLAQRSRLLAKLNFPGALVGGLLGGLIVVLLRRNFSFSIDIPKAPRDLLLVLFYISGGLAMTISSWREAGKSLLPLTLVCIGITLLQNLVGIVAAQAFGQEPLYGVMNGSVAYVGGLGSAVAWGEEAAKLGALRAVEVGVVAATLGLLISVLICGPYVAFLLKRHDLSPGPFSAGAESIEEEEDSSRFSESSAISGLLVIALSLFLGDLLRKLAAECGFPCPRFLTAMLAGVGLSIGAELLKLKIDRALIEKLGAIALNVFIVMSLSGLELWKLQGEIGVIVLIAALQTALTIAAVHLLVFHQRGRSFESAALAGGFVGFMLGSFAVAMATVWNTARLFGPVPRAALLVTLIGGAISNVANAVVIMLFFRFLS